MSDYKNCDPDTVEAPLGLYFGYLTKGYLGAITKLLEDLSIDRYFYVLVILNEQKEVITQQKLADLFNTDKTHMVSILDYLDEKKMLKRVVNPKDRREHILKLTSKGKKAVPQIKKAISTINSAALKDLPEGIKAVDVYALICKICNNLSVLPAQKVELSIAEN
jgi:MarR family transcriptional regulator, transcriptional regulator for hemolysin